MKNIFTVLTLFIVSTYTLAQTTFKGIVQSNTAPLAGATLNAVKGEGNTITKEDGTFEITISNTNYVKIQYFGFKDVEIKLKQGYNTITLEEELSVLNEVVVSASRAQQKRKEVPGAITVINKSKLKDTKAFGVEQVLNDVPGVYISTSKAASNEQHFAATRSPISTRALFLYLEDGIPIRPTAVFNHNALLELNSISHQKVEVLKGPASSIYGSESIGGSFNFITKDPTKDLTGSASFQINDLGLTKSGLEFSTYISDKAGVYFGSQYTQRNNGPFGNSDYEKFASTIKFVYNFKPTLKFTSVMDIIDFRTDTSGSIGQEDFDNEDFSSEQTFTERDANALRFRNTLDQEWDTNNKTSLSFVYRRNSLEQIPSFRTRQFREAGRLTGEGAGRINDNDFDSFLGLLQHKVNFKALNSSLIAGTSIDFSPQDYVEENIAIVVNPETRINESFTINEDDFVLNYEADILNAAWFAQFEINPIKQLKITLGGRFDQFVYDFTNLIENGIEDREDTYDNFSPKLGINYNINNKIGFYGNYTQGFTPPQTSTLYRSIGRTNVGLRPSTHDNFEFGGYAAPFKNLKLDAAIYSLEGKNTLISFRDEVSGVLVNSNAGGTISRGVEFGISYSPIKDLTLSYNGSYAEHNYKNFIIAETITNPDNSRTRSNRDVSNTTREIAPNWLGSSKIIYKPHQIKGLAITLSHELVGDYNTSIEGQVVSFNDQGNLQRDTETYSGHNIFNGLISYQYKNFEIWGQALNIFDEIYAVRASFNTFRSENTFTVGNLRAFHAGVKYNF